jgi:probable HAF family extracellular repeat protein
MKTQPSSVSIRLSLLLLPIFAALHGWACGTGTATVTNLPTITNYGYQVFGLNATGELTGFFYVAFVHPAHAFFYEQGILTDLGTLGGSTSSGYAINDSGAVTGQADLGSNHQSHAFLYLGASLMDLGTLGGSVSSAVTINNAGQVAGSSTLAGDTNTVAFLYTNGPLVNLGTLGGNYSAAFALNQAGVVVGESSLTNGDTNGFVYTGGALADLGTLGGHHSSAFALNDAGMVVGEGTLSNGNTHGFVYAGRVLTDIGTLGGTYSTAFGINSASQVIGVSTTPQDSENHAFVYHNGVMVDLGTLGGTESTPAAINNLGQIVGESATSNGLTHAFIYQSGQMADLNALLATNSGWELQSARFINDSGRIVGVGTYGGLSQWFILDLGGSNRPPVAVAGPDQTVDCSSEVTLDGSQSSDPDNDPLTFEWSLGGTALGTNVTLNLVLPPGTNVVTLKVTDPCGASAQTNVTVRVVNSTGPLISSLSVTPSVLFPPNHKRVPVTVSATASDGYNAAPAARIVSITSNQPLDGDDIQITGPLTARLAAERNPRLGDRIYTITVQCTNAVGNSAFGKVTVTVPKDQGREHDGDRDDEQNGWHHR